MSDGLAIECRGLSRSFQEGGLHVDVLENVDAKVAIGERTSGEVLVTGVSMAELGEAARGRLRNEALGFVYQFHHLLPEFTALENVAMPLLVRGESVAEARGAAGEMLDRVGLAERVRHKPGELSGGWCWQPMTWNWQDAWIACCAWKTAGCTRPELRFN
jgi:lipoprotein-releasing system ATP-binding protein